MGRSVWGVSALALAGALAAATAVRAQGAIALPSADPPFTGVIGRTIDQSQAAFPPQRKAPQGAPNVLLILTDDVGYGASSTFGGPVDTPTLSRLADRGLRFTRFHTAGICSPTRAALLTGRNHHSVGFGLLTELATGFPGYNATLPRSAGTIAEVLRQNGYGTAMFGKHHNAPIAELGPSGPFDRWPTGLGFEYFYGFNAFGTNQWAPALIEGTRAIEPPVDDPNYHFDRDMADRAIAWIGAQKAMEPDKPFFAYYAPGTAHAPHHAPKDWIDRYRGRFDQGWDQVRQETFARQKAQGIVPARARITPRPEGVAAWASLSPDQRRIYARMMEVYAGSLSHADHQIGRVIEAIEKTGQLDNTLIIFIQGDNGASAEGTLQGSTNETVALSGLAQDTPEQMLARLDELGGPNTYGHYPVGWAWATNSPFPWTKQIASHFGGTRNNMVIAWPRGIEGAGGVRTQFGHVVDIAPTILEAANISGPETLNGVRQKPLEGVSLAYAFRDAKAAERHTTQYFELMGNRGVYNNGWFANTTPRRTPWKVGARPPGNAADDYQWELYDLSRDFTQSVDLAKANPAKLEQMKAVFWTEAARYNVLPIDDSFVDRGALVGSAPRLGAGRKSFNFPGDITRIPTGVAPDIAAASFRITAEIEVPAGGNATGVLATFGGRFGGWGFYVLDGRPVLTHAYSEQARYKYKVTSGEALKPGPATVSFDVRYDAARAGGPATGVIRIDGREVASGRLERTLPRGTGSGGETFDIGRDTGTAVADDYRIPFAFNGVIRRLKVDLQ